jgi:predicted GNAT family acetyltransferase
LAFANYRLTPSAVIITHTETPRNLRGRGIASKLVKGALQLIRADGLKVIAGCGFVWIICTSTRNSRISRDEALVVIPGRRDASNPEFHTNNPHTIRIDISGRPSSLHSSTSPFTTGPTFSGVPE